MAMYELNEGGGSMGIGFERAIDTSQATAVFEGGLVLWFAFRLMHVEKRGEKPGTEDPKHTPVESGEGESCCFAAGKCWMVPTLLGIPPHTGVS